MIQACRAAGVRVYADAVVNHMSGGGNDIWPEHRNGGGNYCTTWGPKTSTGSSPYFTHNFMFQNSNNTDLRPGLEFPSVPYNPTDFHCERPLNSWTDPF
jgi:alpha-amylase